MLTWTFGLFYRVQNCHKTIFKAFFYSKILVIRQYAIDSVTMTLPLTDITVLFSYGLLHKFGFQVVYERWKQKVVPFLLRETRNKHCFSVESFNTKVGILNLSTPQPCLFDWLVARKRLFVDYNYDVERIMVISSKIQNYTLKRRMLPKLGFLWQKWYYFLSSSISLFEYYTLLLMQALLIICIERSCKISASINF